MTNSYKILFSIELLHEYFNKDIFTDCKITPSAEMAQCFKGTPFLMRFIANRLYILIKEESGRPYTSLDTALVFRLYLECVNPDLFNYSNLDPALGKGQFLYLSNLAANKTGTTLNLTAPVLDYDPTVNYGIGDFVKGPETDNIFECIRKGSGYALNDVDAWYPRDEKTFISGSDLIMQTSNAYRFAFSAPVKKWKAVVKGFRVSGNSLLEYDAISLENISPIAVTVILLDLTVLAYGRYRIVLEATTETGVLITNEEMIYYDLSASRQSGVIGVIEIFNHLPPADEYSMLNSAGEIKEVKYGIRFANRNALWKYISQTTNVSNIISSDGGLSFIKNDKVFTSSKPIELKQKPDNSFVLELSNSSEEIKAAYPSPTGMKCEKDTDGTINHYYTEIHLIY